MRFSEISIFGVYIAPIAPLMLLAALVVVPLRLLADRYGLLAHVWHPALFVFAVYMIALSAIVLLVAGGFV
jgi:hypothetical protein